MLAVGFTLFCGSPSAASGNRPGSDTAGAADTITVILKSGKTIDSAAYIVDTRFNVLRLELAGGIKRNVSFTEIATIIANGIDATELILGPGYGAGEARPLQLSPAPAAQTEPPPEQSPPDTSGQATDSLLAKDVSPADSTAAVDRPATQETRASLEIDRPKKEETWASENDESYRKARSPIWRIALRAAGNYSLPFGDYYEGFASGGGFEGEVLIAVNHKIGLWVSVSKSGMKCDEEEFRFYSLDPDFTILEQDVGVTAIRYCIGAIIYKHFGGNRADRSMFYAFAGLGAIWHKLTANLRVREEFTGDVHYLGDEETETKFVTSFGGGAMKALTSNLGAELGVRLDTVYAGSDPYYYGSYGSNYGFLADLRGGLVMFF